MQFSSSMRSGVVATRVAASACVALAVCLSGCASKNPLIDAPANQAEAVPTSAAAPAGAAAKAAEVDGNTSAQTVGLTTLQRALWIISPYRVTIQQGNFVSQEMVAQLKEGMTREQVRFVLGTPLLMDIFHADRWDYPFRLQKGSGEFTSSRVAIFFKADKVAKIEGGDLPTEQEYIARIAGPATGGDKPVHEKEEQKGIITIGNPK